jgi:hypothetical protein
MLNLEGGPHRERLDRLRYVLGHPLHLVVLAMLLMTGVFAASAWVFVPLLLFEIAVSALLPRARWVRQRADRRRRERRRAIAARARASLVAYMEPAHGRELTELERRAATARAQATNVGEAMEALLDDWYGLDHLLATYVRLSISHRAARESATLTDRDALCLQIGQLESAREMASSPRLRRLADRQLSLLRSRASCLDHNDEEREALALELGSVSALCRLVHERTFSLVTSADVHGDVERMVAEAQLHDQLMGELSASDEEEDTESEEAMPEVLSPRRIRVAPDPEDSEESTTPKLMLRAGGIS